MVWFAFAFVVASALRPTTHRVAVPRRRVGGAVARSDVSPSEVGGAAAVAWCRDAFPGAAVEVCNAEDGISLSAIFWDVVVATQRQERSGRETVLFYERASLSVAGWVAMVASLGVEGLSCDAIEDAPLPGVRLRLAEDWVAAADVDDDTADGAPDCMRTWVQDVIVDSKVCPFTRNRDLAATGLEAAGINSGPVGYPVCAVSGSDGPALARVMCAFWGSSIALLSKHPEAESTQLLCVPGFAVDDHDAFAKMCAAVVANLKFVQADYELSLVFFHPQYRRDLIEPVDKPAHGHLPPQPWVRAYAAVLHPMDADSLSDAELQRANAQRTSPFTMINILRADQVEAAEKLVPWEVIEPSGGRRLRVSGAKVYAANIWRFARAATAKVTADGHEYLVSLRSLK